MTIGSTLLTVVLAAIGVAAFATDPFVFAVTLAVGLVTLAVLAHRLGRAVNPPFSPPTPDMFYVSDVADNPPAVGSSDGLTDEDRARGGARPRRVADPAP
jgi:hypothetical protein